MIDLLTIQIGDTVEYKNHRCSKSLEQERFTGTYRGFDFWAPDKRPAELWLELNSHQEPMKGRRIRIRASQVTDVWRDQPGQNQEEK